MDTELLRAIAQELRQISAALTAKPQTLGFGPTPKSQVWIFANRTKGGVWYTLDADNKPVIIEHPALTGYLRKLEFKEVVRRKEKTYKLHCYLEADTTYVLESSSVSHFSKGLLSAIASMKPEQLHVPITIVPSASTENEEVLFCNIYQGREQIFAPYDEHTDWKTLSRTAVAIVKSANELMGS